MDSKQPSFFGRVWRSIRRQGLNAKTDRDRARMTVNDLILHLHPARVPRASLRLTYTFGLGGLAVLLLIILIATGILLMFVYTPSTAGAYASIVELETQVYFGQLIRNLHHWSANLLLIVSFLHLLRVFYTAAFLPPREFNWQLGLLLLGLAILGNFTGYLLPWDQLSYWAVTVAGSLIEHTPLVGGTLKRLLLGGDEVSETTLQTFFALHVMLIPLGFLVMGAFHIWRVRKDKISVPADDPDSPTVTTIPHLVGLELVYGLVAITLLFALATFIDAPLDYAADPNNPPNPTKTAWYFMGVQELLFYFHPTYGAFVIPVLTIWALVALPYLADGTARTGVWFRSEKGRLLAAISAATGVVVTAVMVVLRDIGLDLTTMLDFLPISISNGVIPLAGGLLGTWVFAKVMQVRFAATRAETRMALFTLLLFAFLTLTVVGIYFRGEGMALTL